MTIHALDKNFLLEEIPVAYRDRPIGSESKLNTVSDGIKVLKTIATLFREYKPFAFFTLVAVLLGSISIGMFIPILVEYVKIGTVPRFSTLIVAGFIGLLATLMWICGIILQVIVQKHRQLYELKLTEIQNQIRGNRNEL